MNDPQIDLFSTLVMHGRWLEGLEGGAQANLQGANLQEASLQKANLRGANLRGADLREADLQGADLRETGVLRIQGVYDVTAYPDGRLAYGCETHTVNDWPGLIDELSRKHEPRHTEAYAAEIRAILEVARVRTTLIGMREEVVS